MSINLTYYYKPTCPNCPLVSRFLDQLVDFNFKHELERGMMVLTRMDISTPDGAYDAAVHNIMTTPTVRVDKDGKRDITLHGHEIDARLVSVIKVLESVHDESAPTPLYPEKAGV